MMVSVTILRDDPHTDHATHDQGDHHLPRGLQHFPGAVHWALIDVSHNISWPKLGLRFGLGTGTCQLMVSTCLFQSSLEHVLEGSWESYIIGHWHWKTERLGDMTFLSSNLNKMSDKPICIIKQLGSSLVSTHRLLHISHSAQCQDHCQESRSEVTCRHRTQK